MGKLIPCLLSLLLLSAPALGQEREAERYLLLRLLNVPVNVPVKNSGRLPDANPLKIYLATDTETQIKQNLLEWIAVWNKEQGAQFGTIEVVSDFSEAHLALARFTKRDSNVDDFGFSTILSDSDSDEEKEPPLQPYHVKLTEVAYHYIVVRESSRLNILYQSTDTLFKKRIDYSGYKRAKDVEYKLWQEANQKVSTRPSGVNREKDAKFNGYKLSEQLFKLMRARGSRLKQK